MPYTSFVVVVFVVCLYLKKKSSKSTSVCYRKELERQGNHGMFHGWVYSVSLGSALNPANC